MSRGGLGQDAAVSSSSALTDHLAERLARGIEALEVEVDAASQDRLLQYLGLLAKWNGVYNLTSVRDPGDMLVVHLLDSLSLLRFVDAGTEGAWLDVGSGAGLPGLVLALARPELTMHSVDAVAKKIGFQLQVKASLGMPAFHPAHARIEAFAMDPLPATIVSRAYSDLSQMLASIDHLAGQHTRVIAMKGIEPKDEIAALCSTWNVDAVHPLDVPFLGARRCAVFLTRVVRRTD